MTANQIAYWNLRENERSHRATENENERSHKATEGINSRNAASNERNAATNERNAQTRVNELTESSRHNRVMESAERAKATASFISAASGLARNIVLG